MAPKILGALEQGALWGVKIGAAALVVALVLFGIGDYLRVRSQAAAGQAAHDFIAKAQQAQPAR